MTIIEMIRFSLLRIKRHKENIYFILIIPKKSKQYL